MRHTIVSHAVLLLLVASAGAAPPPPDPAAPGLSPSQRLERLFARVELEQSRVRTLSADFVQHKDSELFLAPQEARGRFLFRAPDQVRWTYTAPDPMEVVLDREEMVTWYRDLGRAERIRLGRASDQVLRYLGASNSLAQLQQYFTVTATFPGPAGSAYKLDLVPRYERIAKRLAAMTLWLDAERYVPVRLRYEEAGGDVTEYRFENVEVNAELPADAFRLELPPDVEVVTLDLERGG